MLIICGLLLIAAIVKGNIDDQCLECICEIESNCSPLPCAMDVGSISCGYYQIKNVYWIDCGSPGASYESCAEDQICSKKCVRAYMNRFATLCTGGRTPTCEDYARIHNGGPQGCKSSSTIGYWNKVATCYF